ncbi:prefoldin subunit beta [Methanobrevibacter sp. YE315]|uniref:prefoldin subunit beta n=1 Tax=Methanobrevibacter sp. YE315 TaxID=1609968 RepID=UPI000764E492|nr:prefoldin subunit beta [Methanobrevibacter sp. YE315]AMD17270.1 prefoldin subunit beta [Methanobrevibacter sp. YE315]
MEIPENIQHQLNQFQQLQQQAQAVSLQVQNVEVQIQETEKALEELKKTDESTEVFKQAGTLLIKVEYADALADMEDKLETLQLRKQTMTRQEERVMKKLEEMQATIQAAMNGMGQ